MKYQKCIVTTTIVCLLAISAFFSIRNYEQPNATVKYDLEAGEGTAILYCTGSSTSLQLHNQAPNETLPRSFDVNNEANQTAEATETTNSATSDPDPSETTMDYVFQVSTDYGYICQEGPPKDAIQNAINTLPDRSSPENIYLRGNFSNLSNITLASNINFLGPAELNTNESICMFKTSNDALESYPEYWYADYVSIYNVTFNGLHFKGENSLFAVYGTNCDGMGWELLKNVNILNCEFEGFYRGLCINPLNSTYSGNFFHDNIQSGLWFNFGADLQIYSNTFKADGDATDGLDKKASLVMFDVFDGCKVRENIFISDDSAVGVGIISCRRNIVITENVFYGNAYSIDYISRPFYSSDITFLNNEGTQNFLYDEGVYSTFDS